MWFLNMYFSVCQHRDLIHREIRMTTTGILNLALYMKAHYFMTVKMAYLTGNLSIKIYIIIQDVSPLPYVYINIFYKEDRLNTSGFLSIFVRSRILHVVSGSLRKVTKFDV